MYAYFDNLVNGIEASIEKSPEAVSGRKKYALEIARLGSRLYAPDSSVAWCGVLAPFDLLNAMEVTSCFIEFVGAMLAATGAAKMFIEQAENAGYSTDSCSYHRAVIGAAMLDKMPKPDFMIATSAPCTGGMAIIEKLATDFGKDLFILQMPNSTSEEAVAFLAQQLRKVVEFVEQRKGIKLDPQKLVEAIESTNRSRAMLEEIYALAATVPSPVRIRDLENFGIVMALFLGLPAGEEILQTFLDEYREKVKNSTPGVDGERFRLLWVQNRIQFKNPLLTIIEKEFKASIVVDELNDVNWSAIDPENPFEGMARRALSIPLVGSSERRINNLVRLAKKYKVDGVINPCHWGCRQGTGARGLIERGLKQAGYPVLNLEVDCVDERNFAEGQLHTRLEAFFEMLG